MRKKYDNFKNSLNVLKTSDSRLIAENEIYRTGVIGQFNLTFELAWKLLQKLLIREGAAGAETGSPREILKISYKVGFINNDSAWLNMLKDRNISVHVYNEDEIDEIIDRIINVYIPVFEELSDKIDGIIDKDGF